MNRDKLEELTRCAIIIGEHMAAVAKAAAKAIANHGDYPSDTADEMADYFGVNSMDELLQAIECIKEQCSMADYADDVAEIDQPEKPRPPKKIGPVNKANYVHNRPQRIARSCCHNKR